MSGLDNRTVATSSSDAGQLLNSLIGRTIVTVTGRTNSVLAVQDMEVVVATDRSTALWTMA
jgi:hypothetical protein